MLTAGVGVKILRLKLNDGTDAGENGNVDVVGVCGVVFDGDIAVGVV